MRVRVVIGMVAVVATLAVGGVLLARSRGGNDGAGLAGEAETASTGAEAPSLAAAPRSASRSGRSTSRGTCAIFGTVVQSRGGGRPVAAKVSAWRTTPYEAGRAAPGSEAAWNAEPRDATAGAPDASGSTDAEGRFDLEGLGAGEYVVGAEVPGEPPLRGQTDTSIEFEGDRERVSISVVPAGLSLVVEARRADGSPWHVRIGAAGTGRTRVGDTDDAGRVTFEGLGAGRVELDVLAVAEGIRLGKWVVLPRTEPFVVTEPKDLVELSGRVIEAAGGGPLAGARLTAVASSEASAFAESGPDGVFRLRVSPTVKEVGATAVGFVEGKATLRGKATGLTIAMRRRSRISGQVVETASRAPAVGVHVLVDGSAGEGSSGTFMLLMQPNPLRAGLGSTITDASGRFSIELDATGPAELRAVGGGWCGKGLGERDGAGVTLVELEAGHEVVVTLEVERAARVTGLVLDALGKPAPGASVRTEPTAAGSSTRRQWNSPAAALPAVAGPDGRFVVDSVLPGVGVDVQAGAGGVWGPVVTIDALEPGAERAIELRLARTRTVVVTVLRDGSDAPVANADVSLHGEHDGWHGAATDDAGVATLRDVSAGAVHVQVAEPARERDDGVFFAPEPDGSAETEVPAAPDGTGPLPDATITVHLGARAAAPAAIRRTIAGIVRFADGTPAAFASVSTGSADNDGSAISFEGAGGFVSVRSRHAQAGSDGAFEVEVDDTPSVRLSASISRLGIAWTGSATASPGTKGVMLTVAEGGGTGDAKNVHIRVLDADGKPVASASVAVVRQEGSSTNQSSTNVVDGDLSLASWSEPTEVQLTISGACGLDGSKLPVATTKLGPWAAAKVPAEIRLAAEKTIEGFVRTPEGKPVPGVALSARRVNPATDSEEARREARRLGSFFRLLQGSGADVSTTRAGADGSFRLRGLDDDEFAIEGRAPPGYIDDPDAGSLARGGATGVIVTLRPGIEVVIRVLDADGKPLAGATAAAERAVAGSEADQLQQVQMRRQFAQMGFATGKGSDSRGEVRLVGLDPAASYVLSVDPPTTRKELRPRDVANWRPAADSIRLEGARTTRGVVRSPAGEGLEGVTVSWELGSESDSVETGSDGAFEIPHSEAGELTLEASYGCTVDGAKTEARVQAGAQDAVVVLDPGAELSVRFDPAPSGSPDGEIHIALDDAATGGSDAATAVARGGVHRFRGLRPDGRYTVWTSSRWAGMRVPELVGFATGLLASRQPAEPVTIRRTPPRAITVRFTGPAGLENASLAARRGPARIEANVGDGDLTRTGRTTRIDGLVEGRWRVEAEAKVGDVAYSGSADADAGAGADVELRMEPVRK